MSRKKQVLRNVFIDSVRQPVLSNVHKPNHTRGELPSETLLNVRDSYREHFNVFTMEIYDKDGHLHIPEDKLSNELRSFTF